MTAPELGEAALAALREAFGESLSTAGAVLDAHGRDESGLEFARPGAVLFARGEADVKSLYQHGKLRVDGDVHVAHRLGILKGTAG